MKHVIFERLENGEIGKKLGSYEGPKDDSSTLRSHLLAEPLAIHLELGEAQDEDCVEAVWIEEVPFKSAVPERWIKGNEMFFSQPKKVVVEKDEEVLVDDESFVRFDAIEEQEFIPAHWGLVESEKLVLAKKQSKAEEVLNEIRIIRTKLLSDCDIEIFKAEDVGEDTSKLRALRVALRNCTDSLKEADGKAKLACSEMVASEFVFPKL